MKKLSFLLLALALFSQPLYAAEKNEPELGFWEKLRLKIEQLTPQQKLSTTTAVGGVRGAPVDTNDIYWKGEAKKAEPIDPSELAAFQKAISLVEAGQKDQARTAFSEFTQTYPSSPLRKDAEQASALLQVK
jgi:TolA-binding protein